MESTRSETRRVLLAGCKRHRSESVVVMRVDLAHAIGDDAAHAAIRKFGKSRGPTVTISFVRTKLIQILESAPIIQES